MDKLDLVVVYGSTKFLKYFDESKLKYYIFLTFKIPIILLTIMIIFEIEIA